ncbi:hypothetical protein [Dethiothermospora halolimnae]|uniref:hypothetical protein n=1 Tax=Dethiothermospora halolimnae TaxID=3114390 RepID=UPI003CCB896F
MELLANGVAKVLLKSRNIENISNEIIVLKDDMTKLAKDKERHDNYPKELEEVLTVTNNIARDIDKVIYNIKQLTETSNTFALSRTTKFNKNVDFKLMTKETTDTINRCYNGNSDDTLGEIAKAILKVIK